MKNIIIIVILVAISININIAKISAQEPTKEQIDSSISAEPLLKLPEALALAQQYIKDNNIDISKHYLDNIRLVLESPWMKGKHWILTWRLKKLADGGEIFIIVGMDKQIKYKGGL